MTSTVNLTSLGTVDLKKISVRDFQAGLDGMTPEAIDRFRRMRKLSEDHTQALGTYLHNRPDKRLKGPDKNAKKSARGQAAVAKREAAAVVKAPAAPKAQVQTSSDGYTQLWVRMQAWWEGVDVEVVRRRNAKDDKPIDRLTIEVAAVDPYNDPSIHWNDARVEVVQMAWGKGHSLPGGDKYVMDLAKPLLLKPEHTVIDLNAGLGGGPRFLAKKFKLWLDAHERDQDLADIANDLSIDLDLDGQAPIVQADPNAMDLKEDKYDAIIARELFFSLTDKKAAFENVALSLKNNASILFTDFVLANRNREDDSLADWRAAEPFKPTPSTMEEYRELLADLKYEVRVFEDITDGYIEIIESGWRNLLGAAKAGKLASPMVDMLMDEGKLWQARVNAMKSGRLRLIRCHAMMRKGPARALSDSMSVSV